MFNNSSNLYGSEWLALVFQNRNKNYGAYTLRTESSSIMVKALLIVVPVFVLLFVGPMIYAQMQPAILMEHRVVIETDKVEPVHEMKKEEPKKEEPKAKEQPAAQEPVKSTAFTAPVVVNEPEDKTPPPTTADLQNVVIATTTQEGKEGAGNALPTTLTTGEGGGTGTEGETDNKIYEPAGLEQFPEFPGGMAAWTKFLQKNLRYPDMAQENAVQGKVYISFVIEKDGTLSDVKLVKGIGYGCDDEAMRVIKKSPKWQAGKQNNTTVRVRYNMPINYSISNL